MTVSEAIEIVLMLCRDRFLDDEEKEAVAIIENLDLSNLEQCEWKSKP